MSQSLLDIDGAPSEREALINQNYKHLAALRPWPRLIPRTLETGTSLIQRNEMARYWFGLVFGYSALGLAARALNAASTLAFNSS